MDDATRHLRAAQDGDPRAFDQLVRVTFADVTRLCRYLGDPDDVDDLVQDTYLRALRSMHTFRGDANATKWLIGIARNVCVDTIRHQQRSRRPELTRRPALDATHAVDLEMVIDQLDDDRKHAFVLTRLLGFSYDEAAEICQCPVGTIRSRVSRARAQIAEAIDNGQLAG